jgi:hypothetical protein
MPSDYAPKDGVCVSTVCMTRLLIDRPETAALNRGGAPAPLSRPSIESGSFSNDAPPQNVTLQRRHIRARRRDDSGSGAQDAGSTAIACVARLDCPASAPGSTRLTVRSATALKVP